MPDTNDSLVRAREFLKLAKGTYVTVDVVNGWSAYGPALRDDAPQLVADLAAEVEYASSERVLASTIDRVRMLHSKRPVAPGCTNCSEPWPCSTIRALEVTQ